MSHPDWASTYSSVLNGMGEVLVQSVVDKDALGRTHGIHDDLRTWAAVLPTGIEGRVLSLAADELRVAIIAWLTGFYRSAHAGLRLAFELGLASVHFSAHPMEFREWLQGERDINWSALADDQNGILSPRFAKAFWPDLKEEAAGMNRLARSIYRELSQYVHGNPSTRTEGTLTLKFDPSAYRAWPQKLAIVYRVISFSLTLRHLRDLSVDDVRKLEYSVIEHLGHISPIRTFCEDRLHV